MRDTALDTKCRLAHVLAHPAIASALVALALTALLYGDTLTLPLFSDDLVQIPWLESISWGELWSSPSPYGYYRPVWYSLWRVWSALVGGLHPAGLHFLNVAAHFAASWLAGLLSATWISPPRERRGVQEGSNIIAACLATALFAAFPFARQAVVWPGAVYNPLVSAMAAGALLAYDRGRQRCSLRWIGLALLLAALSAFTYEAGLLVALLIVLVEIAGWAQHRWERRFQWEWPLIFAGLFIVTTLTWRAIRGAGTAAFGLSPIDLQQNASYLVQGLIYPTAPLAQRLVSWIGINPDLGLWLIALPTLALLALMGSRRSKAAFLLGAGWLALFALPPLVSMEAEWFVLAPRFLYMTAAGIALMWTVAISEWLARLRSSWRTVAAVGLLAVLLIPASIFVRDGARLCRIAGEAIWGAAEAAEREHPLLLVNLPLQITPRSRFYPLGFEGVTPLPTRVTADGLVYVHTGIHDGSEAVSFGVVAPEPLPGYAYELHGRLVGWEELSDAARQVRTVYLTQYEPNRIHLVEAGAVDAPPPEGEPLAHYEENVTLLSAIPTCDDKGRIHLVAYWRVEGDLGADVTVFAHLLDSGGALVAQADGYPLLGMQPFWVWRPGEVVRDVRHFDAVPAGEYTIRLGIWELATGKHWLAPGYLDGVVPLPVHCSQPLEQQQ
jgi:hypothetical protein